MDTAVGLFEKNVRCSPHSTAVVCNGSRLSYITLNHFANYIAYTLIEKGVSENSIIAISGEKSFEMIAAMLATFKLQCSYMPVDLSLPIPQIQSMLLNVSYLLLCKKDTIEDVQTKVPFIHINYDQFDAHKSYENLNKPVTPENPAYVMHTSGSTGIPKGIVVPHRALVRLLVNTNYIHITPEDIVLFHSNTSFDAGIFEVWAALLNGAKLIISTHAVGDLPAIFKLCKDYDVSVLLLTTGLFHIFSHMDLEELPKLRFLVVGGDVMHYSPAVAALSKNKNFKLINGYGPAENTVFTTCLVIESVKNLKNPIPIGKPIFGTEVFLLDEKLNLIEEGETGELYTSGLGVALGYLNLPQLSKEKFVQIPHIAGDQVLYRTGDMAKMLTCGNIEFVGRCDNKVKIRGYSVELTEIENVISSLDFVEDVFVCLLNDSQKIAAYVKIKFLGFNQESYKVEILSFLEARLPKYSIPSYIEVCDSFPLTRNGKIDRNLLHLNLIHQVEVNI